MTRKTKPKPWKSRRFLALLLALSCLSFALPSILFCRTVMAEGPLPETGNHVYHDDEYFELYHEVNGESVPKILEYMYAETLDGDLRPVYCVRAGAPSPETGSIEPAVMQDPNAAALLGKIQYVIEMDSDEFEIPDLINGHPHIHYCVRQILIWHLVSLYRDTLSSEAQSFFGGIDLDSFIDGEGSGPTAVKILSEAKRLWEVYEEKGRPSRSGAYTPDYRARLEDVSSLNFDASSGKYAVEFTVEVRETHTGKRGGTFRFVSHNGGKIYLINDDGSTGSEVRYDDSYPYGWRFRMLGSLDEMENGEHLKSLAVSVETVDNGDNTAPQRMYGYFFDDALSPSGLPRQTYVGWYESSGKTFSGTSGAWKVSLWDVDLRKRSVFSDFSLPEEGAEFEVYSSFYSSYSQAKGNALGFLCYSDGEGRIRDRSTGKILSLPSGNYTIRQTSVPEGTEEMHPNPGTFTVTESGFSGTTYLDDEMKAGQFSIVKKIRTGEDIQNSTPFSELQPEENAMFAVWNVRYDSYENAPNAYRDILVTDKEGKARSKILPYGEYRVHQLESEATRYTYTCDDVTVWIRGEGDEPVLNLENRRYEQKLQIRKIDERNGKIVPASGVTFRVLDENKNVLSDSEGRSSFQTEADGTCSLSTLPLPVGQYYIQELSAPVGFVLSDELIPVEVKKDEDFIGVGPNGDMKAVDFADRPVEVTLELRKSGEQLVAAPVKDTGYEGLPGYAFSYEESALSGAVYELYCGEDILDFTRDISLLDPKEYPEGVYFLSEDGSRFTPYQMFDIDGDGKEETPLKEGTWLGTYETDEDGRIVVEGLSLDASRGKATYKMLEVSAPEGYLVDPEPVIFTVTDERDDQTITVVQKVQSVMDERQKVELSFEKEGIDYRFDPVSKEYVSEAKALEGAVMGIYAEEDILSATGETLITKGELIEVIVSDEMGHCQSREDYPCYGSFYVQEIASPEGFVRSAEKYSLSAATDETSKNMSLKILSLSEPIRNEKARANVEIQKTASDTALPMKDVEFEIRTQDGALVEKLITDEEGKATSKTRFPYGEELILKEVKTDPEYGLSRDIPFSISLRQTRIESVPTQVLTVVNYRKSEIRIEKTTGDEFRTPMDGVTFQLWEKGIEGSPDRLLEEKKTDEHGNVSFMVGEGDYYVKETDVGSYTSFRLMDEPIPVHCEKEGRLQYFEVVDAPTETLAEKRSSGSGALLGNCGISVRDKNGNIYSFTWDSSRNGYLYCQNETENAVTVLYTNNDPTAPQFGTVSILGLPAGDYEIFEVEAPKGYRNDSEVMPVTVGNSGVLGVTRLYDTAKTSETDMIFGVGCCTVFSTSAIALVALAILEITKRRKG